MQPEFFTIGVYGAAETGFFNCLVEHGIDTFCDIRFRRGVRGAKYAFVNSTYLQQRLHALGIAYIHYKRLAPSKEIRSRQDADDKRKKVKKRERQTLGPAFIHAYEAEYLADFDSQRFIDELGPGAKKVVLFCVEREPDACHRSLVARRLAADLGIQVEHLIP
jgi:uncharacterized protein (DUF488 family)